jgi:hypothetical protein
MSYKKAKKKSYCQSARVLASIVRRNQGRGKGPKPHPPLYQSSGSR